MCEGLAHRRRDGRLAESTAFYTRSGNASLGRAFLREFDRSIALLTLHPQMGSVWRGSIRRLSLRRFPYSIVYQIGEAEVRIIAVAHHRRRPGFWMKQP